ncbi:MAG: type III secretion system export apparatus subunit SctR [bacterium]|nr:type III secretion system export apparatus subunit SctR [bacterium]
MAKHRFKEMLNYKLSHNAKAAAFFGSLSLIVALVTLLPAVATADTASSLDLSKEMSKLSSGTSISNQPILMMLTLASLSLLPFVGMLVTSFVKIAVVLSITRQAISVQQAPPSTVITGLALILTIYVMHPVGMQIYQNAEKHFSHKNSNLLDKANVDVFFNILDEAEAPMKKFLTANSYDKNIQMFYNIGYQMRASEKNITLAPTDFLVLVPAFVITELTKAFQIGFIIFLPFIVVDMAVANILMALGMQMLAPTTISLPFKILLFVMVDGWHLITKGLVLGYQV